MKYNYYIHHLPSPGNRRPTASASFRLRSAHSLPAGSRKVPPYRANLSRSICSRLCLTAAKDVCRLAGTRNSCTVFESGIDVVCVCIAKFTSMNGKLEERTDLNSVKVEQRWARSIRFSSFSRKSTSIKMFEIAFSFIMGMFLPVRNSYSSASAVKRPTGVKPRTMRHSAM